jgi:hypothetical protein
MRFLNNTASMAHRDAGGGAVHSINSAYDQMMATGFPLVIVCSVNAAASSGRFDLLFIWSEISTVNLVIGAVVTGYPSLRLWRKRCAVCWSASNCLISSHREPSPPVALCEPIEQLQEHFRLTCLRHSLFKVISLYLPVYQK